DVRILFYGQGTDYEAVSRLAREKHLAVELHGLVPPEEIARLMRGAELGLASVRPGMGYDFAFTTKAFAMMSTGLPVLYAGVGPVRTMIDNHNLGQSVDWDSEALAQ